MTTIRQDLLEYIKRTKQPTGTFMSHSYEVFLGRKIVWWGHKIWKVPTELCELLALLHDMDPQP